MEKSAFRLPAEWEPHAATWLAWPTNKEDWPGKFSPIPWAFAEIIRALAQSERVRLFVQSSKQQKQAARVLRKANVDLSAVDFVELALDRGWMRDISPFFLTRERKGEKEAKAILFHFNGWAKYENWREDAKAAQFMAEYCRHPFARATRRGTDIVLEGGAVDGNGLGTILATEECLLDTNVQTRNPGFSKADYLRAFERELGASEIVWLGRGIAGDDTHGHVDDLCRFVNSDTVVLCREDNPDDANYAPLAENRERLQGVRLPNGGRLNVVDLPTPSPVIFDEMRLPASYANFYIANNAVLVPTFNDKNDRLALNILAELFPSRKVVGIHALDLVWGLGTIHCLSHEEPLIG
jgi:agmatine deiminase